MNHRGLLKGMLETFGVPVNLHDPALVAVDKLDKIGREGVSGELAGRGIADSAAEQLLRRSIIRWRSPAGATAHEAMIGWAREQVGAHPKGPRPWPISTRSFGCAARRAPARTSALDPSLARGLSYYTGAIMEMAVPDLAGSLGGGGRYDGLIGMFSGEKSRRAGSRWASSESWW